MSNEQRFIRVRIAVAVSDLGQWEATGGTRGGVKHVAWSDDVLMGANVAALDSSGSTAVATHWIEADIPLPVATTVEGKVTT